MERASPDLEGREQMSLLFLPFLAAVFHGGAAVPLFWIIGAVLILAGIVTLFRGGLLAAVLLIVLGVVLGGLNVF
jgi:hypothetical protein